MTERRTTSGWHAMPPFQDFVGIETIEAADGRSLLRLHWKPELANRKGDVHGGVLATLADLALSQAIRSQAGDIAGMSTIGMTMTYLEPAQGAIVGRGRTIKLGGTIGMGEMTCESEDGRIVATASGVFRLIRHRRE